MSGLKLKNPIHLIAVGFGSGLLPKAPGTWGTVVGIPIYLAMATCSLPIYLGITLASFIVGCYICEVAGRALGEPDHGSIVWDEIVGLMITMLLIPLSAINVILGFVLFRIFDILKPFPIRYFDAKFKNGFGVMLDDVLAGVMANLVLQVIQLAL